MANFNSDQYANSITNPVTINPPRDLGGKVRCLYAKYSTPSSAGPVAGDNLVIGRLPAGARVLSACAIVPASFVTSSAKIGYYPILAADGTIVSTGSDDDRWGTGKDLSSVGRIEFLTVAADADYVTAIQTTASNLADEVAVVVNFTTANPAASKQTAWIILYVVD